MRRKAEEACIILALILTAATLSAKGITAHKKTSPQGKTISSFLLQPFAPISKLDLPILESAYNRTLSVAKIEDCIYPCKEVAQAVRYIDSWGGRYVNKRWLEEKLRSGKTLPAPFLDMEDFQAHLLFPMQGRLDTRMMPVGVLFGIRLFNGTSPRPLRQAPNSTSVP